MKTLAMMTRTLGLLAGSALACGMFAGQAVGNDDVMENIDILIKENACVACNLQGADLNRLDLSGADLRDADLRNAHLHLVNLSDGDLRGADLRGARFGGADLANADLRGADLRGAVLAGTYLVGAKLDDALLDQPETTSTPQPARPAPAAADTAATVDTEASAPPVAETVVRDEQPEQVPTATEPQPAIPMGTDAPPEKRVIPPAPVTIEDSQQSVSAPVEPPSVAVESTLEPPAEAAGEQLEPAAVGGVVVLEEAQEATVDLKEDVIQEVDVAVAAVSEEVVEHSQHVLAAGAVVAASPGAAEAQKETATQELDAVVATDAEITPVTPEREELLAALLKTKKCFDCALPGVDLRGKNLRNADLERSNLAGADLREANLRSANLKNVSLRGADLRKADFGGADLYKADFTGADLSDASLQNALIDEAIFTDVIGYRPDLISN